MRDVRIPRPKGKTTLIKLILWRSATPGAGGGGLMMHKVTPALPRLGAVLQQIALIADNDLRENILLFRGGVSG
jgi:ABC-type lipoprotein export system ATPase subunit